MDERRDQIIKLLPSESRLNPLIPFPTVYALTADPHFAVLVILSSLLDAMGTNDTSNSPTLMDSSIAQRAKSLVF